MQVRKQQLELDMEQQTGLSRLYVVTLLFNLYAEYIMKNAGLDEAQAGIKIAGRNINNLRYADDTIFMAESEEELKNLLLKEVGHSFSSKEQASFNFMTAITICSDFGAQRNSLSLFSLFPHLFAMK